MVYQLYAGTYHDAHESLGRFFGGALPLAAILLLIGFFSYSSHFAIGKYPRIAAPKNLSLSVNKESPNGSGNTKAVPAAPAPVSSASTPITPGGVSDTLPSILPSTSDTTNTSGTSPGGLTSTTGGLGGGSIDTSGATSSLLPSTTTVPPLDLQTDSKQILSTDGTTITIN